jgi:hypothetical protein
MVMGPAGPAGAMERADEDAHQGGALTTMTVMPRKKT